MARDQVTSVTKGDVQIVADRPAGRADRSASQDVRIQHIGHDRAGSSARKGTLAVILQAPCKECDKSARKREFGDLHRYCLRQVCYCRRLYPIIPAASENSA
jgi:hypothetical protein